MENRAENTDTNTNKATWLVKLGTSGFTSQLALRMNGPAEKVGAPAASFVVRASETEPAVVATALWAVSSLQAMPASALPALSLLASERNFTHSAIFHQAHNYMS